MNIVHAGFVTSLAVAGALVSVPGVSATTVPGSAYRWVQPGTALVVTPFAEPPALAIATQPTRPVFAMSSYRWAQPWTAPVSTPHGQPTG